MEITPIGAVLVTLGILFSFTKPDYLYWCAIFFLPFSATAVVNVGSNESYSGLQAWMFFGTLWLAHEITKVLRTKRRWYRGQMRVSVRRLIIFLLVATSSLIMPIWIGGRLSIQSATFLSNESRPLFFSVQHVTQILYLAFGILFAISVAVKNLDFNQFLKTMRIVFLSTTFVCFWAFVQWFCYLFSVPYPASVFNTNKNETAMGYLAESSYGDLGIARISSVATEPSMLAQFLLIVLVFVLFAVLGRRVVVSTFGDRLTLVLAALALLLTTSSTAYLGLALLIPICLSTFWLLGTIRGRYIAISTMAILITVGVLYVRSNLVQDLLDLAIFSKAGSFSALERLNSVTMAWGYFAQYPVLGVGWGSVTSHDLIVKLLANAGLLGLIAFALFLKSLGDGLWMSVAGMRSGLDRSDRQYWACCILVAALMLILTNVFTEFAVVYGYLWFVFAMALAIPVNRTVAQGRSYHAPQRVGA